MQSISRSQVVPPTDSAVKIYKKAVQMLDGVEKRPVRLVGTGLYNLSEEKIRQLRFEDFFEDETLGENRELNELLENLQKRYGLDFAGHLEEIYHADTLHKTVEYMRKHI